MFSRVTGRRGTIVAALLICLSVLIGVHAYRQGILPAPFPAPVHDISFAVGGDGVSRLDYLSEVAYWQRRLHAVGDVAAHGEFVASVNRFEGTQEGRAMGTQPQHIEAHTFGEALYRFEGLKGISVCGQEFSQGCLHAFFGLAVQEYGVTDSVTKLDALCAAQKDPALRETCRHGLGHGILGDLGYKLPQLVEALSVCGKVSSAADFTFGCGGGAYMEYNIRSLLRDESLPVREMSDDTMYQPCDQLSGEYRVSCMFWMPMWWSSALHLHATSSMVTQLMRFCEEFPYATEGTTHSCYEGIGYIIPQKVSDKATVAQLCAGFGGIDSRLLCWRYASQTMSSSTRSNVAPLVCAGLSGTTKNTCLSDALKPPSAEMPFFEEF